MSVWIKLDSDYPTHPKTLRLCRLLGDAADTYPIRLWTWCARYAKTGRPDVSLIEEACRWTGDKGVLVDALKSAGFLDDDGAIHDWDDWTGEFLDQLEARRRKQRHAKRAKQRKLEEVGEKSARPLGEVGEKSARSRRPEGEEKESREEEKREEKKDLEHPASPDGAPVSPDPVDDIDPDEPKGTKVSGSKEARRILDFLESQVRKNFPSVPIPIPEKRPAGHVRLAERLKKIYAGRLHRLLFAVECTFDSSTSWHRQKILDAVGLHAYHAQIVAETEFLWSPSTEAMMKEQYGES